MKNWTPCWGSRRSRPASRRHAVSDSPQRHRRARHSQFVRYLQREAGATIAYSYLTALEHDLEAVIANSPNVFPWFHETGAPYRAKLFRLARSTYWIIYTMDDVRGRVEIMRFWHSARQPLTHGL